MRKKVPLGLKPDFQNFYLCITTGLIYSTEVSIEIFQLMANKSFEKSIFPLHQNPDSPNIPKIAINIDLSRCKSYLNYSLFSSIKGSMESFERVHKNQLSLLLV